MGLTIKNIFKYSVRLVSEKKKKREKNRKREKERKKERKKERERGGERKRKREKETGSSQQNKSDLTLTNAENETQNDTFRSSCCSA